ncbi:MAG: TonB-dependent receptor [Sphingobium sp.]
MNKISKNALLRGSAALQVLAFAGASMVAVGMGVAPAAAQDYNQVNATGRVLGTDGEPVSGAKVTVTSNAQGFSRSGVTSSDGTYRIVALPQGVYAFTVEADGFDTATDPAVELTQSGAANQFTLASTGGSEGAIVVTAGRVQVVDFDRNTTGAVISLGELAQRVPVARDIASVIQLSPGTTQGDRAFSSGNLANISGASVAENAFFLNGLNITNFRTGLGAVAVPFDMYQTVEVKNGGLAAEYGRLTGGLVNATTKSGSNEFHGGLTVTWEPNSLRSNQPNILTEDYDSATFERTDFVAQLSGPIIKDHLFFYGIYNARDVQTGRGITALTANAEPVLANTVGSEYRFDRSTSPFWGAKIDAVITDGQRLEFTIFDTSADTVRRTFGTAAAANRFNPNTNARGDFVGSTLFQTGGLNYVGRYTGSFTSWLTVSGAYGKNKDRDVTGSTVSYSSVTDSRGGANQSIGNPVANEALNSDTREFYRGDVDLFFDLFGSHHIRGGYDHESLSTTILTQAYGIGQVTLLDGTPADQYGITTGEYAQVRTFRNGGTFKSTNEAFYIQDNWSLFGNRLNLQLGLRNDKFTNRNIEGKPFYKSKNQWGPRLGASFDPFGDNSTKAYGSFSRYFFPVAASTNNRLGGAELDQNQFYRFTGLDANNVPILGAQLTPTNGDPCVVGTGICSITSGGTAGDTSTLISSNLKSQSLDEYIVGIERRLGTRLKVNLYGTYRKLNQSLEDAAVNGAIVRYCTENAVSGCTGVYGPGTSQQYILLNPGSSATFTLDRNINGESTARTITLTPDQLGLAQAKRTYKAITFEATREFDGIWSAYFSYTWSKLKGNTEGGVRSDGNGQADTGATVDFDFAGLGDGTYGYLPNDRRHNFKAYGSYQVTPWLNLGANVSVTSPRRFGCLGTVPTSRDAGAATYGANGTYCNLNADGSVRTVPAATGEVLPARQVVDRGTGNKSDWLSIVNLDAAIKVPSDAFDGTLRISVFNVFNASGAVDLEERGTQTSGAPRRDYGTVAAYQAPRSIRLQLGVNF